MALFGKFTDAKNKIKAHCGTDLKEFANRRELKIESLDYLLLLGAHRQGEVVLTPRQLMATECMILACNTDTYMDKYDPIGWDVKELGSIPTESEYALDTLSALANALENYMEYVPDIEKSQLLPTLRWLRLEPQAIQRKEFRYVDEGLSGKTRNTYLKTIRALSQALIDGPLSGQHRKDAGRILQAMAGKVEAPVDEKTLAKYLGEAEWPE